MLEIKRMGEGYTSRFTLMEAQDCAGIRYGILRQDILCRRLITFES
jgi:hypothetical protein